MNSNKNNIKLLLGKYIIITITIFGILFCVYIIMDYRTQYLKYKKLYLDLKNKCSSEDEGEIGIFNKNVFKASATQNTNSLNLKGGNDSPKITLDELSYMLSKEDLKLFKEKKYDSAYTFGTLSKEGLYDILLKSKEYNKTLKNLTFLDIGSGDGRVVIWAVEQGIKRSLGVELSKSRYNLSLEYKKRLKEDMKNKIDFYNDDILNFDIKNNNIDIIYISSLCMPKHLIHKITEKLSKETKKGTIIFTTAPLIKTMALKSTPIVKDNNLEFIGDINVQQSWKNKSNINIYRTY
jgi:16S rRNA G966 N2-methylase RsmD